MDTGADITASVQTSGGGGGEPPIGLLAGGGDIPAAIVRALRERGRPVHVVSLEPVRAGTYADATMTAISIGQIGAMLRAFRSHGCRDIMIAGTVTRPDLRSVRTDLGFFTNIPAILALMRGGDDRLLRRVIRFFEDKGFRVRGMADETPSLLAGSGALASITPDGRQVADGALGQRVITALGALDVGQAVVINGGRVVAIEGIEGTDGMLRRLAGVPAAAGGVLVKMTKPQQDRRIDLPTIGPITIENAKAAGLSGIAVETSATVVADRARTIAAADAARLAVWGEVRPESTSDVARSSAAPVTKRASLIGRRGVNAAALRDAALGMAALTALKPFAEATAAVVSREHVLAVGIDEPAADVIARGASSRPWGDRRRRSRRGTAVVARGADFDEKLIASAATAGLFALHLDGTVAEMPGKNRAGLAATADQHSIALTETCHEPSTGRR